MSTPFNSPTSTPAITQPEPATPKPELETPKPETPKPATAKPPRKVQTQIHFTIPANVFMTSRRQQRRRDSAHHAALLCEEQGLLARKQARAARRARRKAIRKEDSVLADAFSSVSVGSKSSAVPVLGAPVKRDVVMDRVRSRIRKPCKKCRERRRKIRERAEAYGRMDISGDKPARVQKDATSMSIVQG